MRDLERKSSRYISHIGHYSTIGKTIWSSLSFPFILFFSLTTFFSLIEIAAFFSFHFHCNANCWNNNQYKNIKETKVTRLWDTIFVYTGKWCLLLGLWSSYNSVYFCDDLEFTMLQPMTFKPTSFASSVYIWAILNTNLEL